MSKAPTNFHPFAGRDIPWLVDAQAATRGDHPFLIWRPFDAPEKAFSYAEFAEETRCYAAGLAAGGVKQGDFVLIHLDNCPEFLFAWYACSRLGAVAVTTNTRSSAEELAYFVNHCGAAVAITQPKYAALVRQAGPNLRWIACTTTDAGAEPAEARASELSPFESLRGQAGDAPWRPPEPLLPNSVQYTSGTTSRPKGVVWTHANALWSGEVTAAHAKLTQDDVHLVFHPLFHTNALAYSMLSTLWSGGTAVLLPRFSASRFWDVAVRHRCTWANMGGFMFQAIQGRADPERHWFRLWAAAGDMAFIRERWGIKTIGWFGMTETIAQCTVSDMTWIGPEGSMGRPVSEYEIEIRRDDGSPSSVGEIGGLWIRGIRGLSLFKEYLNDPSATAAAFDADGWFDTGDQAVARESGHLFFAGRAKDMLKVGAENVAALEIEAIILPVEGVVEVAVVGKPDRMLDEVPVAFVVARDPGTDLENRIMARCKEALADFKRPREIIFISELPKGLMEKVLKKELRSRVST